MRGLYQFQSRKINFLAAAQETQVGTPLQQTSEAAPGRDFSVRALPRRPRRRAPLGGPRPDSISPRVRAWVGCAIRQLLGGPAKAWALRQPANNLGPPAARSRRPPRESARVSQPCRAAAIPRGRHHTRSLPRMKSGAEFLCGHGESVCTVPPASCRRRAPLAPPCP